MTTNFMDRAAKMIAEIRNKTSIDDADVEVINEILQDELTEFCDALFQYYEEEYHNAISSARSKAYDDGHSDGYADGHESGYADGHSDGYDDGHSDGYADGYKSGYADGHAKNRSAVQ